MRRKGSNRQQKRDFKSLVWVKPLHGGQVNHVPIYYTATQIIGILDILSCINDSLEMATTAADPASAAGLTGIESSPPGLRITEESVDLNQLNASAW